MRIVEIASEAVPFAKTGGLADVTGALSKTLAELGHEVTLILPNYARFLAHAGIAVDDLGEPFEISLGDRRVLVRFPLQPLPLPRHLRRARGL